MAVKHELEIEISPTGEIQLKVKGIAGEGCLELTKALEEALGIVLEREKTSEYYQAEIDVEEAVTVGED
jgi:hypothetical protein